MLDGTAFPDAEEVPQGQVHRGRPAHSRVVGYRVPARRRRRRARRRGSTPEIIAALVNDPPAGDRQVHDLAARVGKPLLFVLQFLKQLEEEGDVQVSQGLGGVSRVRVSPTLQRRL